MTEIRFRLSVKPVSTSVKMYKYVPIPPGGNTRWALVKRSPADFDMMWADVSAASELIVKNAQGAISGHRIVYSVSLTDVAYANQSDYIQTRAVIGMTLNAAADGGDLTIQDKGQVVEPSWNWAPGDVWLANNGQLTQTVPTSGNIFRVGSAILPTVLQLDFQFIAQL